MSAQISPQPLAVGEINKNAETTISKEVVKPTYASISRANQDAPSKIELCAVNFESEHPVIQFTMEDVNIFTREEGLHQAVVIKFSYGKPDISEVRRILSSQFDVKGNYNVGQLEYRHLLVRFDLFDDYSRFLGKSTGYLKSKGEDFFFRTFPWTFGFNPKEETPMAVVWISMPGLPPNLFAKRCLLSIASAVGKPLAVDKATQDRTRPSTARVKVILNLLDKHPKNVMLQFLDSISGKSVEFQQIIVYDNLPSYCNCCKHQGHAEKDCRFKDVSEEIKQANHSSGSTNIIGKLQGDARDYLNEKRAVQPKVVNNNQQVLVWKQKMEPKKVQSEMTEITVDPVLKICNESELPGIVHSEQEGQATLPVTGVIENQVDRQAGRQNVVHDSSQLKESKYDAQSLVESCKQIINNEQHFLITNAADKKIAVFELTDAQSNGHGIQGIVTQKPAMLPVPDVQNVPDAQSDDYNNHLDVLAQTMSTADIVLVPDVQNDPIIKDDTGEQLKDVPIYIQNAKGEQLNEGMLQHNNNTGPGKLEVANLFSNCKSAEHQSAPKKVQNADNVVKISVANTSNADRSVEVMKQVQPSTHDQSAVDSAGENHLSADSALDNQLFERDGQMLRGSVQQKVVSPDTSEDHVPVKEGVSELLCKIGNSVPLKNLCNVDTENTLGNQSFDDSAGENHLFADSAHDDQLIERDGQMIRDSVQQKVVSPDTHGDNVPVIEGASDLLCTIGNTVPLKNLAARTSKGLDHNKKYVVGQNQQSSDNVQQGSNQAVVVPFDSASVLKSNAEMMHTNFVAHQAADIVEAVNSNEKSAVVEHTDALSQQPDDIRQAAINQQKEEKNAID